MRSIRGWYLLSRGGTRGEFLAELDGLSPDALASLVERELEQPPVGSLRTLEEIRQYCRVDLPSLEDLKNRPPVEQTLQYFFLHRGYFRAPGEVVVEREFPTCDRLERRRAVFDLLVFERESKSPLIVELKRAKATDPLFGVVLEALDHWVFLTRNRREVSEVLRQEGYHCHDACPTGLAIAAPREYFAETKRRSAESRERNGEYTRALDALEVLATRVGLSIPLVAIEDGWMGKEGRFDTKIWWQPGPVQAPEPRREKRCFYGSSSPQSFVTVVHQMCDGEFLNLTRSTVPSLHYWREPEVALAHVLKETGLPPGSEGALCFEFPVPSVGRNKPSFSDLAYVSREVSVVFEAKSTEPLGEVVEDWLAGKGHSANASGVLRHWTGLIERVTGRANPDGMRHLPYQMIHRAASLCSLDSPRRALIYQHHRLSEDLADFSIPLAQLAEVIDASGRIDIWLHAIDLERTNAYKELEKRLQGQPVKGKALRVRNAILEGGLFAVRRESFVRIC